MTFRKDLFIFCWFWIKQISSCLWISRSLWPWHLLKDSEEPEDVWRIQLLVVHRHQWLVCIGQMELQNHPKVVYWGHVDTHFPSPPPHTYPTSGTFRFFFLNGNTVNFAMAKTSMWRSHGFSVWITLRLICFTFGLYFLCNVFYCFALPFKYLYHHWELSKLYFLTAKIIHGLLKKRKKN